MRKKLLELEMKYISKSNCLKSWNTSSSSPKMFFEKVILKLLVFSRESFWWSVNRQVNGLWSSSFCPTQQIFSFFESSVIFWAIMFEITFGRLLLEQYFSFSDLVIRPKGILQVSSLLSNNSLLKTFFQRSIIWLHTIIISLYCCYVVIFCTLFMGKTTKQKKRKKLILILWKIMY